MYHHHRAFTLIELVVVSLVLSVASAIAVPSFFNILARAGLRTAADDLADDFASARRAAISRGGGVVLCPSGDGHSCAAGGRWEQGWIIVYGARVLSAHEALSSRLGSHSSTHRDRIAFDSAGLSPGGNTTITLCVRKRPSSALSLVNSAGGRLRAATADPALAAACAHSRETNR